MKEVKLDKVYFSKKIKKANIEYDKENKKRPSWIKIKLNKKIIFIKILVNKEAFWYRRYFKNYFFPLDSNSEDYKNYYNHIAKNYESFVPQNKRIGKLILKFLEKFNIKKKAKILDLGAGTGIISEVIVEQGYSNLTLIDISDKALEIAKNKEKLKNAKFLVKDFTKDKIKGKFDVVLESMSLDYFKDKVLFKILNNIKSCLKNQGIFVAVDRHIPEEFCKFFEEIEKGKLKLKTPEGVFDYYYFLGRK